LKQRAIFVASTGQNVGKTTTCLGLLSGLKKRFREVGFMKPVGQESLTTDGGLHVDKDVLLFKEYFQLRDPYEKMSPLLVPQGFTRQFLDAEIDENRLKEKILQSFREIFQNNAFTLVEGTGHMGVGSVININNAQVAALLNLPVILVCPGGLGSSFDELALNKSLCDAYGVKIAGVILNRVLTDKREMVIHYIQKALRRWEIPLLGCIPFDPFLSNPSMKDFEQLFNTSLLTGEEQRLRHFKQIRLVATSVEIYKEMISPDQLIVTPAHREDIIMATLSKKEELRAGMILTGDLPPRHHIIEELKKASIPMLYAPYNSYTAMKMILLSTTKILKEDLAKVNEAIHLVENHIDFDLLETLL
jgi:phosphate acetyltransferase